MRAPECDSASLERIYDHMFEMHFGRKSKRRRSSRNDVVFGRLLSLFLREGIDPATFIVANMVGLRDFALASPYGFQPNMLSGEKALGRYNAFIRRSNRRYRRGLGDVADSKTEMGRLRTLLALDETDVGDEFVRSRWLGEAIDWWEAVERVAPSDVWVSVQTECGSEYQRLCAGLTAETIARERTLASLKAAVSVVNGFAAGLADRIGVTEFSWMALSDLIGRTFEPPKPRSFDLAGVPGGMWR